MTQDNSIKAVELEDYGVLVHTTEPTFLAWMGQAEKAFIVLLYLEGGTLSASKVKKNTKKDPELPSRLFARDMIYWETDKAGKPSFMSLTWKGNEAAEILVKVARSKSTGKSYLHQKENEKNNNNNKPVPV